MRLKFFLLFIISTYTLSYVGLSLEFQFRNKHKAVDVNRLYLSEFRNAAHTVSLAEISEYNYSIEDDTTEREEKNQREKGLFFSSVEFFRNIDKFDQIIDYIFNTPKRFPLYIWDCVFRL